MSKFYFTFGSGHHDTRGRTLDGYYVSFEAEDYDTAARQMWSFFGPKWAGAYGEDKMPELIARHGWQELDPHGIDQCAQIPQSTATKIYDLLEEAMTTDGEHHKQWYLEKIAEQLHMRHPNEGIAP